MLVNITFAHSHHTEIEMHPNSSEKSRKKAKFSTGFFSLLLSTELKLKVSLDLDALEWTAVNDLASGEGFDFDFVEYLAILGEMSFLGVMDREDYPSSVFDRYPKCCNKRFSTQRVKKHKSSEVHFRESVILKWVNPCHEATSFFFNHRDHKMIKIKVFAFRYYKFNL